MKQKNNDNKKTKQTKKNYTEKVEKPRSRLSQSIAGLLIIFASVLLFVSMFMTSESGPFGEFVKNLLSGFFGRAGFLVAFVLFYYGWGIVVAGDSLQLKKKTLGITFVIILISCTLYLFENEGIYNVEGDFVSNIQSFYANGLDFNGGGVVGGLITVPLILVFDKIGAGIVLFAGFAVGFIALTGYHPIDIMKNISGATQKAHQLYIKKVKVRVGARKVGDFEEAQDRTERPSKRRPFDMENFSLFDSANETEPTEHVVKRVRAVAKKIDEEDNKSTKQKNKEGEAEVIDIEHNLTEKEETDYILPPCEILKKPAESSKNSSKKDYKDIAGKLEETLVSFGVSAKVINVCVGPTVTRFELSPGAGVKVSKIVGLADDLALNLAAPAVRIEAPIPGKAAVGIEIPNRELSAVYLRSLIESKEFQSFNSNLAFALGKDIGGRVVVVDIAKMPHLLIAGATGSGKSVCINTLITSILYKSRPDQVKMLMIDPKVVELGVYNGIPHLLIPVVTDPKKAAGALNWAVQEMMSRYNMFAEKGVRDIKGYNSTMQQEASGSVLPQIVIIIDELADLMMVAPNDVEDAICRLAQMARAAGMHLVIATQRPSVDVITGVIKANIPSRISFAVSSQVDSRTILDSAGAEKLLGKGDMLYYPVGEPKPIRLQGTFVTDKEVEAIVDFVKEQSQAVYNEDIIEKLESEGTHGEAASGDNDVLLPQVADMIVDTGQASISIIQRRFKVGYARAARLIDQLEARGIIGGFEGSKPRRVLMSRQEWEDIKEAE